jgi:dual specificity phosphatase 12
MVAYGEDEPDCAFESDDEDYDERHNGDLVSEPVKSTREEMHEIIPLLWIGDYQASQRFDHLKSLGISVVVAAMRQRYSAPEGITVHQVAIEDNNRTNVMAHFGRVNDIIHEAHSRGQGVLVHCQAGVSRSTTLVAAFLMHDLGLTCDGALVLSLSGVNADIAPAEAVHRISVKRSVVRPTEFFLHQLEMYERMGCEVDPAVHSEYRRFLMVRSLAALLSLNRL